MVIGPHTGEQSPCADGVGSGFAHRAQLKGVIVGARRFDRQTSQQRFVGIRPFKQGHARGDAESPFDKWQYSLHEEPRQQREQHCPPA